MLASTNHRTGRLAVPLTQNTAPVFEFNCLYSHDIRRKQKRWKDGFLKYHTFNKRVMVYDVPRNYIGDVHWLREEDLQEGDELKLEKGGALVQVADRIGQSETDLTELLKSRSNTSPNARVHGNPRSQIAATERQTPLKHKSLNALLGTPRGPLGKATLPAKSPFERRYEERGHDTWDEERSTKKRRLESAARLAKGRPNAVADSLHLRTPLSDAQHTTNLRTRRDRYPSNAKNGQSRESVAFNMLDEADQLNASLLAFSSDGFEGPLSPLRPQLENARHRDRHKPANPRSHRVQSTEVLKPAGTTPSTSTRPTRQHNTVNAEVDTIEILDDLPTETTGIAKDASEMRSEARAQSFSSERPALKPGAKILRLATTVPKKRMLLCHEQMTTKAQSTSHTDTHGVRANSELSKTVNRNGAARKAAQPTSSKQIIEIERRVFEHSKISRDPVEIVELDLDSVASSSLSDAYASSDLDEVLLGSQDDVESEHTAHSHQKADKPSATLAQELKRNLPLQSSPVSAPHSPARQDTVIPTLQDTAEDQAYIAKINLEPTGVVKMRHGAAPSVSESVPPQSTTRPLPLTTATVKPTLSKTHDRRITAANPVACLASAARTAAEAPVKLGITEPPQRSGPWSREAFDLFTWRPPNWDEDEWCAKGTKKG